MDTSLTGAAVFAVSFAALYVAHHVGDLWVQTDHQAQHKGDPGRTGRGRVACLSHVATYGATQGVFLLLAIAVTGLEMSGPGIFVALLVSGVTHYWADRRWTLEWLARRIPGKLAFYRLGIPRPLKIVAVRTDAGAEMEPRPIPDWSSLDQPTLGTGAHALDQSFHLAFSVFVPALILAWAA